jgi:hypothetical protein
MDMHVDKARNNGEVALVVTACGCRYGNFIPAAYSGNPFAVYQNNRIGDFLLRRQDTARENSLERHGVIVLEFLRCTPARETCFGGQIKTRRA